MKTLLIIYLVCGFLGSAYILYNLIKEEKEENAYKGITILEIAIFITISIVFGWSVILLYILASNDTDWLSYLDDRLDPNNESESFFIKKRFK